MFTSISIMLHEGEVERIQRPKWKKLEASLLCDLGNVTFTFIELVLSSGEKEASGISNSQCKFINDPPNQSLSHSHHNIFVLGCWHSAAEYFPAFLSNKGSSWNSGKWEGQHCALIIYSN